MRGKQERNGEHYQEFGITPACAGKTPKLFSHASPPADHPRVCGENSEVGNGHLIDGGSPPRVRGKPETGGAVCTRSRITPACAGKTVRPYQTIVCPPDHPRVCGENLPKRFRQPRARGSPPRVRGKLYVIGRDNVKWRITPACAGKTAARGGRG